MTTNFFHPSLLLRFLDPGSEIRDPRWVKNQDPGSGINIPDPQRWFIDDQAFSISYELAPPLPLSHNSKLSLFLSLLVRCQMGEEGGDLYRTRFSRFRMIWFLPHPLPLSHISNCLSFSVFLCVAGRAYWRGGGGGGTKSHDGEKSGPLYTIQYSRASTILCGYCPGQERPTTIVSSPIAWKRRRHLVRYFLYSLNFFVFVNDYLIICLWEWPSSGIWLIFCPNFSLNFRGIY
jgi:hypothetical protein